MSTNAKFLAMAAELIGLLESIKAATARADALKAEMKDALPNGCHVFGDVVIDIRSQVSTRLDKEALCEFFNVDVAALEPFTVKTECRQLSAKRAVTKTAA